jgi:hypothetical protein
MWDSRSIAKAIRDVEIDEKLEANFIHLKLFDLTQQFGIGTDGKGRTILVLPGQDKSIAFETEFANYDPWSNLIVFETHLPMNGVSILRCDIDREDTSTVEAAAAIFFGLLDLQKKFGKSGDAIWQLKSLFANRLKFEIDDAILTGLIGEMIILLAADDTSLAMKYWHSNIDDKFDFSGSNFRLEVKTTTSHERNHHFSSSQIPGNVPEKTFVASVKIIRVESGCTIQEITSELQSRLSSDEALKLHGVVQGTLGVPVDLLSEYQIDLEASLSGVKIIKSLYVPSPEANEGVLSMNWLANLDNVPEIESFYEDFFVKHQ